MRAWDVMSSNLLVTTSFASGQNIVDQKYRQFSFRRCYATKEERSALVVAKKQNSFNQVKRQMTGGFSWEAK